MAAVSGDQWSKSVVGDETSEANVVMSVEYKIYLDPLPSSALATDNEEPLCPGNCSRALLMCPLFCCWACPSVGTFQGPAAGRGMHSGQISSYLWPGGVRCGPWYLIPTQLDITPDIFMQNKLIFSQPFSAVRIENKNN